MINNFTNINKTNNHLSPQLVEHMTLEIQVLALEQEQKYGGVKPVNGIPILVFFLSYFKVQLYILFQGYIWLWALCITKQM